MLPTVFLKSRSSVVLIAGLLAIHAFGQEGLTSDKKEQEKITAQAAAAAAEKRDKAVAALLAEVQSVIATDATVKTCDALLLKISTLGLENRDRYGPNQKIELLRSFTTHYQDYLFALSQENFENANQAVAQMIQESALFPVIPRSDLLLLQKKVGNQASDSEKAALAPLLKKLDEIVSASDLASDTLDSLSTEVDALQTKENSAHPNRSPLISRLQEIRQFCGQLKEYSAYKDAGKNSDAQNSWRGLINSNNYGNIGVTSSARTKLMKSGINNPAPKTSDSRTQPNTGQVPLLQSKSLPLVPKPETVTLDNLDGFVESLRTSSNPELNRLQTAADLIRSAREQVKAQQPAPALRQLSHNVVATSGSESAAYSDMLNILRVKLMIQAIAVQCETKLLPKAEETPGDYLKRIVRSQIDAKNWRGAYDAMKVVVDTNMGSFSYDDYALSPIFLSLVTAPNQEAAGQYGVVVQNYLQALKCPSTLLPADEIIAQLAKIKADHPNEYKAAQLAMETPQPASPYVQGRPGIAPARPPGN